MKRKRWMGNVFSANLCNCSICKLAPSLYFVYHEKCKAENHPVEKMCVYTQVASDLQCRKWFLLHILLGTQMSSYNADESRISFTWETFDPLHGSKLAYPLDLSSQEIIWHLDGRLYVVSEHWDIDQKINSNELYQLLSQIVFDLSLVLMIQAKLVWVRGERTSSKVLSKPSTTSAALNHLTDSWHKADNNTTFQVTYKASTL